MQLLKEPDLSLDKAIRICQASESAKVQLKSFDTDSGSAAVDAVQRRAKGASRMNSKGKAHTPDESNCDKCGGKHAPRSCPAYGRDCNKCGRKNHYARCCFSKKTVQVVQGGDTTDSEEDGEAFFVGAVEGSESSTTDEWIADLGVNGATIPLKLDTGAQVLKETTPRSYEVLTEHGSRIRRNRRHLLKIPRTESHDPENGDAVEVQSEQLAAVQKQAWSDVSPFAF
ncbi:hypothetical protein AAFF_G00184270 [Aldrovandia affinis]|uniref:Uncharacterized protein n=1 Tax=Aldrovandia affinis TaxID=143900 RepID=A0AAD7RK91_9TELE|nr:hypothetical protein AAFF_G00184270 [Aldrovandia affinis]